MLFFNLCHRILKYRFNSQIKPIPEYVKRFCSLDYPKFPGADAPFITKADITLASTFSPIPIYRVLNRNGSLLDDSEEPQLKREIVQKMYRDMVTLNAMDKILYESQRQGRISFYMTNYGEEATHIGSAAALEDHDLIYAQYREVGVLLWRGFTLSQFIDQCFGNADDNNRGKQMPVHYGSRKLNFVTISSPLATQMPQAAGSAYAMKCRPGNKSCVICYFGEGTASEGDAHAAFNFASTLSCPVIFFCRNNGFAISTPTSEQYKSDGIAGRAASYGMAAIRVDGTDTLSVYNATKLAREYTLKNNKPIILEAMSYRISHHSTSDDSTAYRSAKEIEVWNSTEHPITKLKNYMTKKGWFQEATENQFATDIRKEVMKQLAISEKKLKPNWNEMFKDVYSDLTPHLIEQKNELKKHIDENREHYPLKDFKSG